MPNKTHLAIENRSNKIGHCRMTGSQTKQAYGEEMTVFGRIYYQNDVRRIIVEELDFATVMDAYELFKRQYRSKGAKLLAWLILREHLSQDELAGLMVEYDMGRGA